MSIILSFIVKKAVGRCIVMLVKKILYISNMTLCKVLVLYGYICDFETKRNRVVRPDNNTTINCHKCLVLRKSSCFFVLTPCLFEQY